MIFQRSDLRMTDDNLYGGGVARFPHGLLVVSAPESSDAHDEPRSTVDFGGSWGVLNA